MNETTTIQPELPAVEAAPGEKHSAVIARGISMPPHQVREAIKQAVSRGQLSEEDGEEIFWLYSYAQEYHLKESDLAAKMGAYDKNTLYQVFRGSYGVYKDGRSSSWNGIVKSIRAFKAVELEEMKKKNIGVIDTEVKETVFDCCDAALSDGWPVFIYGNSQIGKTTALVEYKRLHNHGRTWYIRLDSGWTRARFVRELAQMLGNGVKATKCWALEDAIHRTFTRYNLLIVDEFHLAFTTLRRDRVAELLEFIRGIHDRTGCGIVMCATKVGLEAIERSENRMTFEQFTKRGVVKAVLPDLPPTKDLNKIAKTFGLPLPTGETLKNVKSLVKSRGLGVYIKFMQKAYAFTRQKKLPLTWEAFGETANTYLKLSYMKTEQY